ncbi:MAG TPA: Hsp20/alpha crystallin family protein [Vicinamibacterales bacterium]|nr:Hsp20/alpha crystallin family protein [Vicinamibacterales bacterium]
MSHLQIRLMPGSRPPADELRQLVEEIGGPAQLEDAPAHGEHAPAIDVLETDRAVEVVIDLAGVPAGAIRVVVRHGLLLVVGEKHSPSPPPAGAVFHVAERSFGRFVRVIRLSDACDARQATASVRQGELRIVVPTRRERRGDPVNVRIQQVD